jgi:hypothetical protein
VTWRLDFSELTINEHYPESIQLPYEYSFGCEDGTAAIAKTSAAL